MDRNADDPALPDEPKLQVFYGQPLYITRVTLHARRKTQMRQGCDVLLGTVQLSTSQELRDSVTVSSHWRPVVSGEAVVITCQCVSALATSLGLDHIS